MKLLSITCAYALLLGGCATQYVPPSIDSGPTARVRMLSISPLPVWGLFFKEACVSSTDSFNSEMISYLGRSAYGPVHKSIGMPISYVDPKTTVFAETVVRAGTPLNMGFHSSSYQVTRILDCHVGVQFTPEKNSDYELTYETNGEMCGVNVRRLRLGADNLPIKEKVLNIQRLPRCN